MPVEVTKYTCQFRCGSRAVGDIKRMAAHEKSCWNNPDNKTCKTCSNEIYESDSDGYRYWISRGCKIDALNSVFENTHDILSHQNNAHIRPIYNCPYHDREADESTLSFAQELEAEIKSEDEGTTHYPFFNKPKLKTNGNTY